MVKQETLQDVLLLVFVGYKDLERATSKYAPTHVETPTEWTRREIVTSLGFSD